MRNIHIYCTFFLSVIVTMALGQVHPATAEESIVVVTPTCFTLDDEITIVFDATKSFPSGSLLDAPYVFIYSGLITEGPESGNWNLNHTIYTYMFPRGDNKWSLTFTPRSFYNVPSGITAFRIAMVFFDEEGDRGVSHDGSDIFIYPLPSPPPPAPVSLNADFISNTGFEARWMGVDGVAGYRLDVATDQNFTSFVDGYYDKMIFSAEDVVRTTVGGLSPGTDYYYRVRAGDNLVSDNAASIAVLTKPHPPGASRNIWAKQHGGEGADEIQSLTSDLQGNIYAAGHFGGTMKVGNSLLVSEGDFDIFLIRYDRDGNVIWAHSIGGTALDNEVSLATDSKGLYMTGQFSGAIDVDPGEGTKLFYNQGQSWINDGFFARFNLDDGALVWANQLVDASTWSSSSIAVDSDGLYLAGRFNGVVDFDPADGVAALHSQGDDVFIAKYSLAGHYSWVRRMGGYGDDAAWGLMVDPTGLYIHGHYGWDADFDPDSSESFIFGSGGFFGRYDRSDGSLEYIKSLGNGTIFSVAKFANSLFLSGDFSGIIDADPGEGMEIIGTSEANSGLVARYDLLDGTFRWANALASTVFIGPRKVLADGSGVYVNGYFGGSVDFDAGVEESNRTAARIEAFMCRYSANSGDLQWAKEIGHKGWAVSIAATLTHHGYYVGGLFGDTVNLDPYSGSVLASSYTSEPDIFIGRYELTNGLFATKKGADLASATSDGAHGLGIFPNPANSVLQIEWNDFDARLPAEMVILSLSGEPVMRRTITVLEAPTDVSGLARGYYVLQVRQPGKLQTERFFKK